MTEDSKQYQTESEQELSCGAEETGEMSEIFNSEIAKDFFVPAITFNWGRNRLKECEWREGYLTIFSDGRYDGKTNLRCNKGSFFSCDSMETEFFLYVGEKVVFSFQAPTKSVGGATDTDIYYSGWAEAIKSFFNQINRAGRKRSGYCS